MIAPELAELAGLIWKDTVWLCLKLEPTASKTAEELIDIDAKTFELNGNQVRACTGQHS